MAVYPGSLVMREARDAHLAANGFSLDGYTARTFTLKFFGIPVTFPNTKARQRALPLHDLHHIVTGYGTDWKGEAEIGAWELRGGCNSFILYWLNGWGVLFGIFLCPGRVYRAFRRARGQRTLYRDPIAYDTLMQMTVREVRQRLDIQQAGLAP